LAIQSHPNKNKNQINSLKNRDIFVRKVILENFLSFQKDEVDFGDSKFIIIVGPNWSGKTSIFQAIKFALGSNERDERYPKWSDFIRNGNKHAMVELHIQNLDDVIKIRRTVIRGKSPFFEIKRNKDKDFRKSQANEIQKIVTELKINPDNQFAFVSQGKIDAIKNLKPTELCSFLEEGIGLKALRNEILQQKSSVLNLKNDLISLNSKKNALNISLELLRPKIERLKQKKKLLEIKKIFSDELLWSNRNKLKQEIEKIDYEIVILLAEINQIKKKKEEYDGEIEKIQKKISENEQNIDLLSEKSGELKQKKQVFLVKIQSWQKEKLIVKQELDALAQKINEAEKVLDNFNKKKERLDNENKIINEKKNKTESHIDDLIKEQNQLAKKIKINTIFLEKYNQLILNKKEKLKKIQENENKIKIINNEINQLFQSFKDIEHKLEKNKWFLKNPTKNLLQQLDKELRKATLKLYEIESEIRRLEITKSKKFNKLKHLQASLRERRVILPSNINILKDEIIKRDLNVKGPIIEHLNYNDELSYAIESVLGEKLLYSFVANNWDTLNLLKRLKKKYNVYCNIYLPKKIKIMPLNRISAKGVVGYLAELIKIIGNDIDIKKVIYSKVKNCLVVKDYQSGKELYKTLNFKGKCVTLKGEQIISYKYVYETPFLKRLKGFLSTGTQKEQSIILENEIKSLNELISEFKVEQSKLDNFQSEVFKKKESFNDLLYNFNQKQRLTAKKNHLYEQIYDLENKNANIQNNIKDHDVKIKDLETQKDPEFFKWNDRFKEIPIELDNINNEKKKWDLKYNESHELLKEVQDEINLHDNMLNIVKLEHETKKENFQKSDKTAFNIYRELENTEEEIDRVKENIFNFKEYRIGFQKEKGELDQKIIQITLNLERENIKLNSLKQEIESKNKDLERINSEIGPLISEKKIKIRPIEEIKEDVLKIDKELLKYFDVEDSILVEKEQIIASLKEIAKNNEDLEKDIKAAIKTENKMENTYYAKFDVVLQKLQANINQKFTHSQIRSYCSLELSGDFKDLGVDIKAATSQKQLKSFTALSGGQVSIISICLILSLQEIKPSPLVMMDEPIMFLDDKNSEIAYQLIKITLEQNPLQMLMFLPKSSNSLYQLAEKLIGIARVGKNEISSVFKPKIVKKKIND